MFPESRFYFFSPHFVANHLIINTAFCSPSERQHERFILTGFSRAGICADCSNMGTKLKMFQIDARILTL